MTWIKPSFMWLMHRSNWARKPGQERVLAVRITREGWEDTLSQAVLTTADPAAVAQAAVHVQWDPERSPRGAALNHYSIQVGIGRHLIRTFNDDWIVSLTDLTPKSARPRHWYKPGTPPRRSGCFLRSAPTQCPGYPAARTGLRPWGWRLGGGLVQRCGDVSRLTSGDAFGSVLDGLLQLLFRRFGGNTRDDSGRGQSGNAAGSWQVVRRPRSGSPSTAPMVSRSTASLTGLPVHVTGSTACA